MRISIDAMISPGVGEHTTVAAVAAKQMCRVEAAAAAVVRHVNRTNDQHLPDKQQQQQIACSARRGGDTHWRPPSATSHPMAEV